MHLYTPPYLTAVPEVLYHKLTHNDKFLVLATDGLWDWLDPDTVVRLINDHQLGAQTLTHFEPKKNANLTQVLQNEKNLDCEDFLDFFNIYIGNSFFFTLSYT